MTNTLTFSQIQKLQRKIQMKKYLARKGHMDTSIPGESIHVCLDCCPISATGIAAMEVGLSAEKISLAEWEREYPKN